MSQRFTHQRFTQRFTEAGKSVGVREFGEFVPEFALPEFAGYSGNQWVFRKG